MKYKILKGQLGLKVLSEKSDNTQVNNVRRPAQKIKYNYVPMSYSNRMKLQAQKYKDDNSLFSGSRLLDRTKELGKVIKTPAATLAASATAVASPTIAARLLTGSTSAVGFGQLGMGSGNSLKDASYGMLGEAVAPLVGKVLDKGIGAAQSAGRYSEELINKGLQEAKSLYYNKAPWTFKPNPNSYYRAIPREAIDDAIETGVIRHKPKSSKFLDLLELKNSPDPDVASKAAEEFSKLTLTERLNVGSMADPGQTYFLKGKPWTQKYSQRYGQQDYGTYGDYFIEASDKVPFIPIKTKGRLPPEVMKNLEKNYNPEIKGIAIPKANVLPEKVIPLDENVKLYKPNWFYGFKEVPKPKTIPNKNVFKSEIDWGKWNKEIPQNKKLLNEYNEIEKSAKESGNWMKNTDGSNFKGTPEQFVQQQSSNFKKAFGESKFVSNTGLPMQFFHGTRSENFPEVLLSPKQQGDKFIKKTASTIDTDHIFFTPEYSNALGYAQQNINKVRSFYINSKNPLTTRNGEIVAIPNKYPITKNYDAITNTEFGIGKYNPSLKYEMFQTNPNKDFIISEHWQKGLVPDPEIALPSSNYPKASIGNNGMFDMTNPNIYKAITGISAGLGALKLNKQ